MADIDVARGILLDGFERAHEAVPQVLDGLTPDELRWRPDPGANPIVWLVWHVARMQDEQVADLAGTESGWAQEWADRIAVRYDWNATG